MWCFIAQAFSGPVVEAVLGQGYLLVSDFLQLAVFGEELTDQAVQVIIGAAFPGGMGMSEVVVQLQVRCDPLMLGELLAVVGGQSMRQPRKGLKLVDDMFWHCTKIVPKAKFRCKCTETLTNSLRRIIL